MREHEKGRMPGMGMGGRGGRRFGRRCDQGLDSFGRYGSIGGHTEVTPPEAVLLLDLKICLNVFVVSRVVSLAQPASSLIDSPVNFRMPKIRSVLSSGSVATALIASSVSFSQFRTLSEVREVQFAARA